MAAAPTVRDDTASPRWRHQTKQDGAGDYQLHAKSNRSNGFMNWINYSVGQKTRPRFAACILKNVNHISTKFGTNQRYFIFNIML